MSTLFLRTLRDNPADAEVASHKLLVRAGYIRRVSPGIYSWLPLGMRVLQNIEKIVRDEMNHFGAQEIHLPALLPREPYEVTGRWTEYGDNLFRLKDRKDNDMLLGPTHEEMFAGLVKSEFTSYKDFPVVLYQIQTKYRDEERPRAGILRGREFVMKDSYSFDMDDAGLGKAYQDHRVAYQNIFDRLGVDYAICSATSGAMGGSASEEFLAVAASGEDTFVRSTESDYAANVEAVKIPSPPVQDASSIDAAKIYETQNTPTIQTLVDWANKENVLGRNATAQDTLKNIVVKVHAPGEDEARLTAIAIPGDREVDFKRLEAAFEPSVVTLAEDKDFADNPFLVKGYIGPKALRDNDVPFYVDPRVVDGTAWITGADQPGKHYVNLVMGRDFDADGILDVANIVDGDPSPDGQGTLTLERGIEIGHIFQLGRKYTDAFEVDILDQNGKRARPTMGSYGLGVTRLIGVLAEQMHDDAGLRWPVSVAPFQVHIVIANKDDDVAEAAAELAESLDYAGVSVLLDDRLKVSPGVKFKDAELIGNPYVVVVGRGLADGTVELRERLSGEKTEVAYNEIQDVLASKLSEQA